MLVACARRKARQASPLWCRQREDGYRLGHGITLSEREAEELRHAAAADAGRSSARRDLSLLLERGLRTEATVALSRAEARELAELLAGGGAKTNFALLQEALLLAPRLGSGGLPRQRRIASSAVSRDVVAHLPDSPPG
jgi:hypothetical protein